MVLPPGTMIGDYCVLSPLGSGSSATVVLAEHRPSGDRVALKVSPAVSREGSAAAQEFLLLKRLDDRHVVGAREHFAYETGSVLVLDFVAGFALSELLNAVHGTSRTGLKTRAALNAVTGGASRVSIVTLLDHLPRNDRFEQFSVRIALDIARALTHAHSQSVFHRDVKPENILVNEQGQAVLCDFSVAGESPNDTSFTGGTLSYMSAGQLTRLAGIQHVEISSSSGICTADRCDVYALGIVLYELLTGELPYPVVETRDSVVAAAREALPTRCLSIERVRSNALIDTALRSIVAGCLNSADGSGDGYRSAAQVAEDLDRWLQQRPLKHAAEPVTARVQRHWRRHRRMIGGLLIVAALLLALAVADRRIVSQRLDDAESAILAAPTSADLRNTAELESQVLAEGLLPDDSRLRQRRAALAHALAFVYLQQNYPEQALQLLGKATALDDSSAAIWNDKGAAHFRLRQFEAAVEAFDRALTRQPNSPDILSNRGAAYAAMNDADRARKDFEAALAIDATFEPALRHVQMLNDALAGQDDTSARTPGSQGEVTLP